MADLVYFEGALMGSGPEGCVWVEQIISDTSSAVMQVESSLDSLEKAGISVGDKVQLVIRGNTCPERVTSDSPVAGPK